MTLQDLVFLSWGGDDVSRPVLFPITLWTGCVWDKMDSVWSLYTLHLSVYVFWIILASLRWYLLDHDVWSLSFLLFCLISFFVNYFETGSWYVVGAGVKPPTSRGWPCASRSPPASASWALGLSILVDSIWSFWWWAAFCFLISCLTFCLLGLGFCFVFFCFLFSDRVLLYSSDWPLAY